MLTIVNDMGVDLVGQDNEVMLGHQFGDAGHLVMGNETPRRVAG